MIFAMHKTMHTWRATLCIAQDHAHPESHSLHCTRPCTPGEPLFALHKTMHAWRATLRIAKVP